MGILNFLEIWTFIISSVKGGVGSSGSPRGRRLLGSVLGTAALLLTGPSRSMIGGGFLPLGGMWGLVACEPPNHASAIRFQPHEP